MKISIERTENGFIVEYPDEWSDGETRICKSVFADEDTLGTDETNAELASLKDALVEIKERLGYFNSKHNKHNLYIEVKDGS